MSGWIKTGWKVVEGAAPLFLPRKTWVPVIRLKDIGVGPTILAAELYGILPTIKPTDIQTKWVRLGPKPPDPTKRTGLVVGTRTEWAGVVPATLEYISLTDLPIELQIWQNGPEWYLDAAIAAAFNPTEYIVDKLT